MDTNYENIEKYILGELTADELLNFENRLQTDAVFKEEVDLYIETNKLLSQKYSNLEKENGLNKTLENMGEKHFNQSEKSSKTFFIKSNIIRITAIAAVLVLGFFLLKPQTDLYTQFAEHSALEVQVKGDNDAELLKSAQLFNEEKYEEAIPKLEAFLSNHPNDDEIQLALGISYLETNQIKPALIRFSNVYGKQNIFKNKASWYMALAYLKSENKDQARAFLGEIEADSFYFEKAQKLQKKIH